MIDTGLSVIAVLIAAAVLVWIGWMFGREVKLKREWEQRRKAERGKDDNGT